MPAPLARGIIITVSVIVAASIAVYHENPHIREWIDRARQKIAMGFHSLGDEIHPRQRVQRQSSDASMHEEKGAEAEERRRQALAEIMEKGRIMEERRKRKRTSDPEKPSSPSFDTLVDHNGVLRAPPALREPAEPLEPRATTPTPDANSSSVEAAEQPGAMRQRNMAMEAEDAPLHQSVDALLPLRQLSQPSQPSPPPVVTQLDSYSPFESRYEQEMRDAWNLPLSDRGIHLPSSHPSESLIDFTPTTEDAPDPDFSVPSAEYLHHPVQRSDYFTAAASNSTHTLSDHASQSSRAAPNIDPDLLRRLEEEALSRSHSRGATTPSVDGSVSQINASEAGDSMDDVLSELGDGIRTPASAWTEVDSTFSGEN